MSNTIALSVSFSFSRRSLISFQVPSVQFHLQVRSPLRSNGHLDLSLSFPYPYPYPCIARRKPSQRRTRACLPVSSVSRTTTRTLACVAPSRASSSYTTTAIPTSSCSRSPTRSSSCASSVSLFVVTPTLASRPGDYLKPGEDEIDGLKRRLDERLAPPTDSRQFNASHGLDNEWEIGDCLAQWWRPNFETFMVRSLGTTSATAGSHTRGSTRSSLHTSPNPRNARSSSSSRCPNEVRSRHPPTHTLSLTHPLHRSPRRPQEHEASRHPLI